jgi:CheY-like chemotaxis protein
MRRVIWSMGRSICAVSGENRIDASRAGVSRLACHSIGEAQVNTGVCDVLVADDQPPVRQMMRLMLTKFGMTTIALARDGSEAVAMLADAVPRVLISDVNMPTMNGLELVQRVRSGDTAAPRDLPILMLTGHGEELVVATALALDVDGFVLKPASPENLKPRIDRVIAHRRTALRAPAAYHAVPIPDVTLEGSSLAPVAPEAVAPDTRVVPLDYRAIDRTLARPLTTAGGTLIAPADTVLTRHALDFLGDLVHIGVLPGSLVVHD